MSYIEDNQIDIQYAMDSAKEHEERINYEKESLDNLTNETNDKNIYDIDLSDIVI